MFNGDLVTDVPIMLNPTGHPFYELWKIIRENKEVPRELIHSCHEALVTALYGELASIIKTDLDLLNKGMFYLTISHAEFIKIYKATTNVEIAVRLSILPLNKIIQPLMITEVKRMDITKQFAICTPIPKSYSKTIDIFKIVPLDTKIYQNIGKNGCEYDRCGVKDPNKSICSRCVIELCSKHQYVHRCKGICGDIRCNKEATSKFCPCMKVAYCSTECQKLDWFEHKKSHQ